MHAWVSWGHHGHGPKVSPEQAAHPSTHAHAHAHAPHGFSTCLCAVCVRRAQGRKRTREEDGVTIQTGGVAAAAAAAAGDGKETKRTKTVDDFYRFQRRDKQRNGEQSSSALLGQALRQARRPVCTNTHCMLPPCGECADTSCAAVLCVQNWWSYVRSLKQTGSA